MNAPKSVEFREAVARIIDPWAFGEEIRTRGDAFGGVLRADRQARREAALAKADAILALSGPVSGMDTSSVAGVHCEQDGSHTGGLTPLEKELVEALKDIRSWAIDERAALREQEIRAISALIAKAEATATEAQHSAGREPFGLTEAEAIAFMAGWNARETGSGHRADGRESCLGMFASGFNFGDSDTGEDISREPPPPPAAPPSPAPPSSEREGSRAGDRS